MVGPGALQRARRLCHWGPAVALAVVAVCSATAMADAALWYWPLDTAGGSVNFVMLLNWTVMILYNYFSAMFVGPGKNLRIACISNTVKCVSLTRHLVHITVGSVTDV